MEETIKSLIDESRYDEAMELLNKAILESPNNDELYYLRGYLYKQLGKWGESLSDLNHALELNPNSRASVLRQLLLDILNFYHTDLYNP